MTKTNVLVAGGTGLVGANLTKRLLSLKTTVEATCFSRKPPFYPEIFSKYDFTRFDDCLEATQNKKIVYLCAAQIFGAKMMRENPSASLLPNLKIVAGLLEACYKNKVEKIILVSSTSLYQEADTPLKEEDLDLNVDPPSIYMGVGWFNRYIEKLALFYRIRYGMKIGIVRPTSIYGPYDNFGDEGSHVIPALIKRAFRGENSFVVWGNGEDIRDFYYVEDLISDILTVGEKYCDAGPINLGSGKSTSVKEVVAVVLKESGCKATVRYDTSKPTSLAYRVMNLDKAKKLLGDDEKTSLDEGIKKTIRWYKKNGGFID